MFCTLIVWMNFSVKGVVDAAAPPSCNVFRRVLVVNAYRLKGLSSKTKLPKCRIFFTVIVGDTIESMGILIHSLPF